MPWPVYLALKHLFPTGRGLTAASLRRVGWMALLISSILFTGLLAFLQYRGVLSRLHFEAQSWGPVAEALGLVWLYIVLGVGLVVFIFRCTPFFNAMSIFGIMLGVTVLITVQSVMNGFAHEYESVFIRTEGHLTIAADALIKNPVEIAQLVRQVPGVKLAEPVVSGFVMMQHGNTPAFPKIRSMDVDAPLAQRSPLAQTIVDGSFDNLDDQGILIGAQLANEMSVRVGDKVDVYTPLMIDRLKHKELLMPKELRVVGIFNTNFALYDANTVWVTLRRMRELYNFDDEAHAIEVRLDNDDDSHMFDVATAMEKQLAPLNARLAPNDPGHLSVYTWQEMHSDQIQILYVEKSVMFYIMVVILIVASFCILCSLATSVVRKTREIGVLGAMGAGPGGVAGVFCLQGLAIGVVGTLLGIALALFLLHFRHGIVNAFVDQRLIIKFYNVYAFPVQFRVLDFVKIIGFTFVISTLAGVLPAWWAARLKPADCLRYE